MQTFLIHLASAEEVRRFVELATAQTCDISVTSGDRTANGKSFMGMFSLDYSVPATVHASGSEDAVRALTEAVKDYIVR